MSFDEGAAEVGLDMAAVLEEGDVMPRAADGASPKASVGSARTGVVGEEDGDTDALGDPAEQEDSASDEATSETSEPA